MKTKTIILTALIALTTAAFADTLLDARPGPAPTTPKPLTGTSLDQKPKPAAFKMRPRATPAPFKGDGLDAAAREYKAIQDERATDARLRRLEGR